MKTAILKKGFWFFQQCTVGVTALFWDFPTLSRAYIQEAESHDIMTETGKQKRVLKGVAKPVTNAQLQQAG